jgi:hypothetical protein
VMDGSMDGQSMRKAMMPKPFDPRCNRQPDQIEEYVLYAKEDEITADEYVISYEGTYNPENGHFACTQCYIEMGMPSSATGWRMP